jgi:hypothetical protein
MRDDLTIAAGAAGAVATMRRSVGRCPGTVGVSRYLPSGTVATVVSSTTTCGFIVLLAVFDGGHLSDSVVNSHEVGVFPELGDDFSRMHSLSLTCYRGDRHEAMLWGSVHSAFDLVEGFREVTDGKGLVKTSAPFIPLSVALTSGVPVSVSLVCECIGRQLIC